MKLGWKSWALAAIWVGGGASGATVSLQWDQLNIGGHYDRRPLTQNIHVDPNQTDFHAIQVQLLSYYGEWKRIRRSLKGVEKQLAKLRSAHRSLRLKQDVRQLDWESAGSIELSENIAQQAKWRAKMGKLHAWEARHQVQVHTRSLGGREVLVGASFGAQLASR